MREGPMGVQWENQILARIQFKHDIYLVSGLDDNIAKDMKITPFNTIEESLAQAFKILGNEAEIAVIPEGSLVLPLLED
jgi:nickel-dependent lactate racemase